MKKDGIKKVLLGILGAILIIGSIVLLTDSVPYLFNNSAKDVDELITKGEYLSDYENKYVSVYVDFALDKYARTDHKRYAITTGTDYHYGILLGDDSIISVDVSSKKENAMDKIVDDTWDYLDYKRDNLTNDPIVLKGKLKKLGSSLYSYYEELLNDLGIDKNEYQIHYYTIDSTTSPLSETLISIGVLAIGTFMLVSVIKDFTNRKEKEVNMMSDGGQDGY